MANRKSFLIFLAAIFAILLSNAVIAFSGYNFFVYNPSSIERQALAEIPAPLIKSVSAYPDKVMPGQVLLVTASVEDAYGIKKAVAIFDNEKQADEINMLLISGTRRDGVYETRWIAHDTKNQAWYNTTIIFTNILGKTSQAVVEWQDPTVTHKADEITAGTFDAGNFIFPNSLNVSGSLNATSTLYTTSTGKVGIGTTSPNQKLDVVGSINASGDVNVSGTALPKYSDTRFKVGSFTRDMTAASGTQAITGVGFQPKVVIFLAGTRTANMFSIGFDVAGTNGAFGYAAYDAVTANSWAEIGPTASIYLIQSVGNDQQARIDSLDSDGFTLFWAKNGLPTGTANMQYLALR